MVRIFQGVGRGSGARRPWYEGKCLDWLPPRCVGGLLIWLNERACESVGSLACGIVRGGTLALGKLRKEWKRVLFLVVVNL